MVVADPEATLLTACEKGYGKRTPFGPNATASPTLEGEGQGGVSAKDESAPVATPTGAAGTRDSGSAGGSADETEEEGSSSGFRYRTQHRGGKGLRDIKTTERNGPVIGIVPVKDDDELMMMTARGKIQRVKVSDFNPIGRNTQGVRIMSMEEGDTLAAIVRVPSEEREAGENGEQNAETPVDQQ
jgi:DNA gyrase subunit A